MRMLLLTLQTRTCNVAAVYHKPGTLQYERDRMKDHILKIYGILLLRLDTNGSGETAKIMQILNEYEKNR